MLIFLTFYLSLLHLVCPDVGGVSSTAMPSDPYAQNLTVTDLTPRSISLEWSCKNHHLNDKYEVTLKPLRATYRVVETVPHNSCFLTMENLIPDTDYQVSLTLFSRSFRRRSNTLTVKTPRELSTAVLEEAAEEPSRELKMPRVRLVELSLVGLALILWIGAIVLFFHRWGKIRMLLPYQPDFKEGKPNGSTCTNCSMTPHHQSSRLQHMQIQADYHGLATGLAAPLGLVTLTTDTGCSPMRPRLNSFVGYSLSEAPIPMELRICRKSKSAEQLPLSTPNLDEEIEFTNF